MTGPRSYCPISLLECLLKCLEKVIITRILYEVGNHNLVPFSQFGGRDHSSCVDAGLAFVHELQATWPREKFASLLTLDIEGYLSSIYAVPLLLLFHTSPGIIVRAYVDNFSVLAVSDSHTTNVELLRAVAGEAG